jgi:hypothetical protein
MANAELATRIAASAEKVWSLLAGPDLMQVLLDTYAAHIEVIENESGAGPTIETTLRSGGVVRERVELLDSEERCLRYRVLDAGPLPYAAYRGEARVQPCGANACVVSFQCTFIPVDASEVDAVNYWREHNREVLAAIRGAVEKP